MTALVRPVSTVAWELRTCWASGHRVRLLLEPGCAPDRVEGWLQHVSATGAACVVGGVHVPVDRVLAVRRPSRLSDHAHQEGARWSGRGHDDGALPGQLRLSTEGER